MSGVRDIKNMPYEYRRSYQSNNKTLSMYLKPGSAQTSDCLEVVLIDDV